ncbi:hypothetical protein AUJ46_03020 [Candidatus Peregrinibacteria bacterium CG1_02_54_53]|nr:MAG: hypothetical protein AUJ46_03020 [Candidatus Peregrinibacteria bacterium CG1_02_54_53]
MVASHIFIAVSVIELVNLLFPRLSEKYIPRGRECSKVTRIQLLQLFLVFLFSVLLIEYAVLLVAKSETPKTVRTSLTIRKEKAVAAIVGPFGMSQIVRFGAVHTFDAQYALKTVQAFNAAGATVYSVGVVTVLIMIAYENHVTVLILLCAVRVITVKIVGCENRDLWGGFHERIKLGKEWFGEIEVSTLLHCIPLVRVPFVLIVNRIRTIRRINGNDLLAREAALAMIEPALIAPCKPSLPSASGAEGRLRQRYFFKKGLFLRMNSEGRLTETTGTHEGIEFL